MGNIYLKKSIERLNLADYQIKTNKFLTLGSTLYFALFNFMQFIIGEPPEGKWKHGGILSNFSKKCYEERLLDKNTLKKLSRAYEDLYIYRLKSDYKNTKLMGIEKLELISLKNFVEEVIKSWQK